MTWREAYRVNPSVKKLSAQFDGYETVDWPREYLLENRKYYHALKKQRRIDDEASISSTIATSSIQFIEKISKGQLIKSRLWSSLQTWLVLTIIGLVIGSVAALLNVMSEWLNDLKVGYCEYGFFYNEQFCCLGQSGDSCAAFKPWSDISIVKFLIHVTLCVAFGLLASMACKKYAPFASGSGISEVKCIVSGFNKEGFLALNTFIVKALTLPFVIASGLAVGKEGPSVHYASCVGYIVPPLIVRWFKNCSPKMSDFIAAGAASGVAVAFGSPISGVIFSLEEISNVVSIGVIWKSFYAAFIATSTLQAWNPFGTGQIVMFEVKYDTNWNWWELPLFILLGIFGGIYGVLVSKFNIKYVAFRKKYLSNYGWQEVGVLCLITAVIGYSNPYIKLEMTRVMELLFDECKETNLQNTICLISNGDVKTSDWIITLIELTFATILRMILICISYGSKVPCGIFVPSMAVGATFGKALGLLVEQIHPNGGITSGTYAFLGAGAALSGITGLSVTVAVIMFELTGALKYVVPTMIVVIFVKIVMEGIGNGIGGIADQMVKFNGMPYLDVREDHDLGEINTTVGEVMLNDEVSKLVDFKTEMTVREVKDILSNNDITKYPIVYRLNDDPKLIGTVETKELKRQLEEFGISCEDQDEINDNKEISFVQGKTMHRFLGQIPNREENIQFEFESIVDFELQTINKNASIYKLLSMHLELGSKFVYIIDDENTVLGVVSRKDLIKYDNYNHWKQNGDIFVSEFDEIIFDRIWLLYKNVGNFIINSPYYVRNLIRGEGRRNELSVN